MKQGAHGGNVYEAARYLGVSTEDIHDYSSNVSPYPIDIKADNESLSRLPEPHSKTLAKAFADKYGYEPENICITSGTTEAIDAIFRIHSNETLCIMNPTYADYAHYAKLNGMKISGEMCKGLFIICNPNNPTGLTCPREYLPKMIKDNPNTLFIYDESYMPFHLDEENQTMLGEKIKNLLILRSFSKIFGLPGLRLGAVVGSEDLVGEIRNNISPWSVNSLAQSAGLELLKIDTSSIAKKLNEKKVQFLKELAEIDFIEAQDSDVNFMLCKMKRGKSNELFDHCLSRKVLIRDCANFEGLDDTFVRFAVTDNMKPLLEALREF